KEEARLKALGKSSPVADAAPMPQQTIDNDAAPVGAYDAPPPDASQPAVGGSEGSAQNAQPASAPPAQTASSYAPPQAPEAGTLPPIDGSQAAPQTYQQ